MRVSLGTVKSRLTRGREALRRRLTGYIGSWSGIGTPKSGRTRSEPTLPGCDGGGSRGDVMKCAEAKSMFSPYLDGAVTGTQMTCASHREVFELPPGVCAAPSNPRTAG